MSGEQISAAALHAAAAALADALRPDPFYAAISQGLAGDEARRRAALAAYFAYSMREGARLGRLVIAPQAALGAAVWLLPGPRGPGDAAAPGSDSGARDKAAKADFLAATLGADGADTYRRIVAFMAPRAAAVIADSAWYLSILGVAPAAQGRGIGARLLEPTLAAADRAGVACFLETFDVRNPRFYRGLGFAAVATHVEPLTGTAYAIMVRPPPARAATADGCS